VAAAADIAGRSPTPDNVGKNSRCDTKLRALLPLALSGYPAPSNLEEMTNGLDNSDARGNLHRPRNQRLSAGRVLTSRSGSRGEHSDLRDVLPRARRAGRSIPLSTLPSTRSRLLVIVAAAALLRLVAPGAALAADPRYPDWPCNQLKVPEISVAAVWAGPAIDDVRDTWQNDPAIRDLVDRLAARRTPMDEAEKLIADFLTGSAVEKEDKAKRLFAGVFERLNRQRSEVMTGIERITRKQKALAGKIRSDALELRTLHDAAEHDPAKVEELTNQVAWSTRVFEDRRKTISYVCEVPALIERRLFSLARAIQQEM
jgi:hypothetical protein